MLRGARVEVSKELARMDAFRVVALLLPYFQLEDLGASLRIAFDLPARSAAARDSSTLCKLGRKGENSTEGTAIYRSCRRKAPAAHESASGSPPRSHVGNQLMRFIPHGQLSSSGCRPMLTVMDLEHFVILSTVLLSIRGFEPRDHDHKAGNGPATLATGFVITADRSDQHEIFMLIRLMPSRRGAVHKPVKCRLEPAVYRFE